MKRGKEKCRNVRKEDWKEGRKGRDREKSSPMSTSSQCINHYTEGGLMHTALIIRLHLSP